MKCVRSVLEDRAYYLWQPETLQYNDVTTGNEVWRLTFTPDRANVTQDISSSHWSADGKRVAFGSNRQNAYKPAASSVDFTWFIVNTDGSRLRTGYDFSNANWNWSNYPAWNPAVPDTIYLPGNNRTGNYYTLYANTIADTKIDRTAVVSVDSSVIRRLYLKKGMAPDGSKLLFTDFGSMQVWVVNLKNNILETSATGYSAQFNLDTYWGDVTLPIRRWHDNYVTGAAGSANGIWNYILPEGTHTWWRGRLTGQGKNGEPIHFHDHNVPYVWGGQLEPIGGVSNGNYPWGKIDYLSHFTPDRWGAYGIFSKTQTSPYGTSLMNLATHDYWNTAKAFTGGGLVACVQHHDWEAWSDWSVSTGSPANCLDYRTHRVAKQNYKDPKSQTLLVSTHTLLNSSGVYKNQYSSLPRPTQSPDGTKVMFNSSFLSTADNAPQIFWVVSCYPYPPEIKSAIKNGSYIRLTWDFRQGSSGSPNHVNPRTYATRGWPHETDDLPPSPREINVFRVWVSNDDRTWRPLGTTPYNNCRGNNECGTWTEKAWSFDVAQPVDSTRYYALTSLEHSGLESHTLSNVWKVVTDAAGNISRQLEQTPYPVSPGGKSQFYTILPDAPKSVAYVHKQPPASADGNYTITWSAPADSSLVRYYNIYAADGSIPKAIQQNRIASVPASSDYIGNGSFRYVDCWGNANGNTKYIVTAVDFQGNESIEINSKELSGSQNTRYQLH